MGYGNGEFKTHNIITIQLLNHQHHYLLAIFKLSHKSCQNKKTASTSYYRHKSYLSEIIIILFYTVRVFSNSALAFSYCCSVIFNISQASSTVPIFFANVSILFTSISAALSSAYSFAYSFAYSLA